MNEYDVLLANPVGNITAIVLNENVKKENYIEIANKLMDMEEFHIEQVGFVKKPQLGGYLRLEMMGGEFCGNATRSFGLYIAQLKGEFDQSNIEVEISGCSHLLTVETNLKNNYAKTEMPISKKVFEIELSNGKKISVLEFEGIFHAICEEELNDELYEDIKKIIYENYCPDALGVIFTDKDLLEINPIVYVKETDSKVFEQSCGSGSIAAAIYFAKDKYEGIYSYNIKNPGGIIEATLHKSDGQFTKAFMGGEVLLSEIVQIQIL